jgi:hypothetical protein
VAIDLAYQSDRARSCHERLSEQDAANDKLTVLQRLELGDREAIYDAVVDACNQLDALREKIGCILSDADSDLLAELREAAPACMATICSSRWNKQETAETDRGGKERTRSAASKRKTPASHG